MQVDKLPPSDTDARRSLLAEWTATPPGEEQWQVGGSTNFMIAASRLGLDVCCCGHVGDDTFGSFLLDQLRVRCPPTCDRHRCY